MKSSLVRPAAAIVAAALLAACNGGNTTSTYPTPGPNCVLPSTFTMMYPENNSTAPANTTEVYIASQNSTLANGSYQTVWVPPDTNTALQGGYFTKVPLSAVPTPRATPGFSNPVYYESSIGPLSTGSTYQIYFNNVNSSTNCTPTLIDTFTTQ
ncbi:MAG TPA: hypothetical protein VMH02_02545 [Verrucomicrobiae bacterium]|nr:hypothetical protein [Verrucomicrobiae bacterium]